MHVLLHLVTILLSNFKLWDPNFSVFGSFIFFELVKTIFHVFMHSVKGDLAGLFGDQNHEIDVTFS